MTHPPEFPASAPPALYPAAAAEILRADHWRDVLGGDRTWSLDVGEALDALYAMPAESVDAIVTDPPYASTGDASSFVMVRGGALAVPRELQFYEAWIREHLAAWKRVLKPGGAVWMTLDWRGAAAVDAASSRVGFRPPVVGVWHRGGLGMGHVLRKTWEAFVVLTLPGFKRRRADVPDLWQVPWGPGKRKTGHAAEKPVELGVKAVELVTDPGGVVLDPFCGSGSFGVATLRAGRAFIGLEREGAFYDIARERLLGERAEDGQGVRPLEGGRHADEVLHALAVLRAAGLYRDGGAAATADGTEGGTGSGGGGDVPGAGVAGGAAGVGAGLPGNGAGEVTS